VSRAPKGRGKESSERESEAASAGVGRRPTREEILSFLEGAVVTVARRELARAFNLKGPDRVWLREEIRAMKAEGLLKPAKGKGMATAGGLPAVTVIEITGRDEDGEVLAMPAVASQQAAAEEQPVIWLAPDRSGPAPAVGERVLARLQRSGEGRYAASIIRRLGSGQRRIVGVFEAARRGGGLVRPTNRKLKDLYTVTPPDRHGAQNGELVLAEAKPRHARLSARHEAIVVERLGSGSNPQALSLIAIAEHGLPDRFPEAAVAEAEALGPVPLGRREDLRDLPLVTIDGADARDFDDAVFAEPDPDPGNSGGFRIVVAIADVAHYVRPGSPLDKEALERGNSTYFPDRVVPMLPEALSNGWCSLRPDEERPCLACHMTVDAGGRLKGWAFRRGLMRSRARLTYEALQAAADGKADAQLTPLLHEVVEPLYAAFRALDRARAARGTLELEIAERRVQLNEDGTVAAIVPRARLDSHRLIELFMVTANEAAATALEARSAVCMYRVHEPPDPTRVEALAEVLSGLGIRFPKDEPLRPPLFARILEQVAGTDAAPVISELVLRAQSQAHYAPENFGHFGLALDRYAHFTSPIRRYADLLVHRSLIAAYDLGEGGLPPEDASQFADWGRQISQSERRSVAAERDATDRFTALYLAQSVGKTESGRISGVTRFGLFVRLDDSGADGLVPVSSLPDDYYDHDETQHALVGRRWGRIYPLGQPVVVRLREANALTASILFELLEGEAAASPLKTAGKTARRPRGSSSAGKKKAAKRKASARGRRAKTRR